MHSSRWHDCLLRLRLLLLINGLLGSRAPISLVRPHPRRCCFIAIQRYSAIQGVRWRCIQRAITRAEAGGVWWYPSFFAFVVGVERDEPSGLFVWPCAQSLKGFTPRDIKVYEGVSHTD